jgi:hypothetical protein
VAESSADPETHQRCRGLPAATSEVPSAGPADNPGNSTAGVAWARAIAIAALIGIPAFAFLVVITWGAILAPLAGLLLLAPFIAVSYLLWARCVAPPQAAVGGLRVDEEVGAFGTVSRGPGPGAIHPAVASGGGNKAGAEPQGLFESIMWRPGAGGRR